MPTQAKGGRSRLRASLDRARQVFSTPLGSNPSWQQKPSSPQGNGDGHSLLHLEPAPPSVPPLEPSLPYLSSGGSGTTQTSRAKSMTAATASPRVISPAAAPAPTPGRISGTAGLAPGSTTTIPAHTQPLIPTRNTTSVCAEQSHSHLGRTSWFSHPTELLMDGPPVFAEDSEALPPVTPQLSSTSTTKVSPAVTTRGSLDLSSRAEQSQPSLFPASPPLSAAGSHRALNKVKSNLSLQQLQPTPPFSPAQQHARSRSTPRLRSSTDAAVSRHPHHPSVHQHHVSRASTDAALSHYLHQPPIHQHHGSPLRHPHPSPARDHQRNLQHHHHHHHRYQQHHQQQQQQVFSTPTVCSRAGLHGKPRAPRSMDHKWTHEADPGAPLGELQQQALKELEELCKLRESSQPEPHESHALRPASPTLYAPTEDSSLCVPKLHLSSAQIVEPRSQSHTQTRRSSFLSLYGTDDEELSTQASYSSRASPRSGELQGIRAEASTGSSSDRDRSQGGHEEIKAEAFEGSSSHRDAPPQDFLASSLYKLTVPQPSPCPPPEEPDHLQTRPLPSHASSPRPPRQQQHHHQNTFQSTTSSHSPNAHCAAALPGTRPPPHRPTHRRSSSVGNITCGTMSFDASPKRTPSTCGMFYTGMPQATDVARAFPQACSPSGLRSRTGGKSAPSATVSGTPNRAYQVSSQPQMTVGADEVTIGGQVCHQQQQKQHESTSYQHFPHPPPPPPPPPPPQQQQQQQQHTASLGTSPAKMVAHSPRADPVTPRDTLSNFGTRLEDVQPVGRPPLPHQLPHHPPQVYAPHPPSHPSPLLFSKVPHTEQPEYGLTHGTSRAASHNASGAAATTGALDSAATTSRHSASAMTPTHSAAVTSRHSASATTPVHSASGVAATGAPAMTPTHSAAVTSRHSASAMTPVHSASGVASHCASGAPEGAAVSSRHSASAMTPTYSASGALEGAATTQRSSALQLREACALRRSPGAVQSAITPPHSASGALEGANAVTQRSSALQVREACALHSSPGAVHTGLQPHPPTSFGDGRILNPQPHTPTTSYPSLVISPELQEAGGLHAPEVPSPSDWSKMAAQAADRRHKVDKNVRWQPRVSETNPIAFDDKAARGAEADHRAAAEHAHECIQGLSSTGTSDPKASTQFLGAMHDLQAHRPYFVSPLRRREVVSRASFKEDSPPPDDSEHSDREQHAAGPQEWTLKSSTFANRDFDSPEVLVQQLAKDWQRVARKPRLRRIILRLLPAGATEADLEQELAKVRAVFATHQVVTRAAFLYYSCLGASVGLDSLMVLHLSDFHAFTRDCNIADPKAPGAKPTELETAFIAANFDEGTEVTELKRRCAVDGILRFEFMELLIRVSISKFIVPKVVSQLSEAVSKLFEEHLIPHLPEAAKMPADIFRHRLYCQEVEAEFLQYWDLLQAVFKVYKAKDRTKSFWPDHWLALLTDLNLLGPHTGINKACAKVLVGMSQMAAADELKSRQRAVSLSFLDLLEALGRLSEVLSPPCLAEMAGEGEDAAHLQYLTAQQQQRQQTTSSSGTAANKQQQQQPQQQKISFSGTAAPSAQAASQEQKGSIMGLSCSVAEHINYIQAEPSLANRHAALSGMGGRLHKSAQQRPLAESLRPLLELLVAGLQARWVEAKPGASKWEIAVAKAQTVSRMLKVAQAESGGIELNR